MHQNVVIVAGIDIGGAKKGNHLVVLKGQRILCSINHPDPNYLVQQCHERDVSVIGIDSPCGWGLPDFGRAAEKALAKERIFCFSTPVRERAASHATGFYDWMLNGERLYQALSATHPLLSKSVYTSGPVCFETFPHAIACAMLGTDIASAKLKRHQRRQLLEKSGIDTQCLKSIDAIDAALCALTAQHLVDGKAKAYGDADCGYIFVPSLKSVLSIS
jgi:predicted nuclease with RNAse H fold